MCLGYFSGQKSKKNVMQSTLQLYHVSRILDEEASDHRIHQEYDSQSQNLNRIPTSIVIEFWSASEFDQNSTLVT